MTPRPILKTCPSGSTFPSPTSALPFRVLHSPHVHFPPTPTIVTDTQTTHSPYVYDRAPIVVSPNMCKLPERGGRVYSPFMTGVLASPDPKGSYFHPRAYEVDSLESPTTSRYLNPPPPPAFASEHMLSDPEESDITYASPSVNSPAEDVAGSYPLHQSPLGTSSSNGSIPPPGFSLEIKNARLRKPGGKKSRKKCRFACNQPSDADNELYRDGCLGGF